MNLDNKIKNKSYLIIYYNVYCFKIISLIFIFLCLITYFVIFGNLEKKINFICHQDNACKKWIVVITFKEPSISIINLEKILDEWKIVVVGANSRSDKSWKIFKYSNKLFYLSLKDQIKLNYNINKYLKYNSYFRKSIGYLYAIQYGAKEIFELDENLEINVKTSFFESITNKIVCYGKSKYDLMINPYFYFGEKNIWPRGFKISDLGKEIENEFYLVNVTNIALSPLVYQGLINDSPDIDSLCFFTKIKDKRSKFLNNYPLVYLPGNYVPLNSKNTKYLYEIFSLLMFPISLDESIADIWRGYLIQFFVWKYNGFLAYHNSEFFQKKFFYNSEKLISEKKNYLDLDKYLDILKSNFDISSPLELIKLLVFKKILKEIDIKAHKAFTTDLNNLGYEFSNVKNGKIPNISEYKKTPSEFKLYLPPNHNLFENDIITIIGHSYSQKKYEDILLIINYNNAEFIKLNDYMKKLYKKYFPNMVFINPSSEYIGGESISCNESYYGYYSYKCFANIVYQYPSFNGYLLINDDDYMKPWELENLDFHIPWIYELEPMTQKWCKNWNCEIVYDILDNNIEWKKNITQFIGSYNLYITLSDFYYLPKFYAFKFCDIIKTMYTAKLFLECAVPITFGILLSPKYQIIYYEGLWGESRKKAIYNLYHHSKEITIHPIKFSNFSLQNIVDKYVYFMNAVCF